MANRKLRFIPVGIGSSGWKAWILGLGAFVAILLFVSATETFADDLSDSVPTQRSQWVLKVGENLRPDRRPVVSSVALSSAGDRLAVVGDDHRIRIYTVADHRLEFDVPLHRDWIRAAVFHPTRSELYTGGDDGMIRRISVTDARMEQEFARVGFPIRELSIRADGSMAVAGFSDRILILDDKGETIQSLEYLGGDVRALAFSPGGKYVAAGGRRGTVLLWDVDTGRQLTEYRPSGDHPVLAVEAVAFSSDGRLLAVGGKDRIVRIWNVNEGQLERRLAPRAGAIRAITFCGSDRLVESRTSAAGEHPLRVWNLATGQVVVDLVGHTGTVNVLLFDTRTGQLVSSGYDTTIRGWQLMEKPRLSPAARGAATRLGMQSSEDRMNR